MMVLGWLATSLASTRRLMPRTIAQRFNGSVSLLGSFLALLLAVGCGTSMRTGRDPTAPVEPLRVMTFNIRYDNPADGVNAWPNRKDWVASLIRFHAADVVGVQEA